MQRAAQEVARKLIANSKALLRRFLPPPLSPMAPAARQAKLTLQKRAYLKPFIIGSLRQLVLISDRAEVSGAPAHPPLIPDSMHSTPESVDQS